MLYRIKTVDGTKKKVPLAGSTPAGLPVGSILSTYKKIQPYNYLYCDGSTFDETQYPELYLYLGTNVLPDYRECVQVGAEKNTTDIFDSTETDPSTGLPGTQSHDVFTQGQFKDDQIQNFDLQYADNFAYASPGNNRALVPYNSYPSALQNISTNARIGTTTRTKEKAVYYYIKAVDGVDIADEDTFLNTVVNTIQDAQSYSTTEQKTGGKWIDGKDIYRIVLDAGSWLSNLDIDVTSLNIDTYIHSEVLGSNNAQGTAEKWLLSNCSGIDDRSAYLNTNNHFVTGGPYYKRYAIIEYTKNE
jgi:hypothetical protein